ncbi:MAG: PilN domain-containing protein [Candidatus Eremiobacteraeota bacterium]|nr:PilN domain-containing protein [Candidatus Eremiobacteraeota bacterium]
MRSDVDVLLALDAKLRRIRLSGSMLSHRLADIGNHVPSEAWLTSIVRTDDGLELRGRAQGLHVLSETVADLMSSSAASSPTLVRAVREEHGAPLISFTIRAEERN